MFLTTGQEKFRAGEVIFREGSHGTGVYLIASGKVEISKIVQGKKVSLEVLGPCEILGEMSFIDHSPRSATAMALEDTVLELLDKDFLDREFNQIASDFREILIALVKRLRKTTQKLLYTPRREGERVSARVRITFKNASDFFRAYIANLGEGGLFIKTTHKNTENLPVGTEIDLELNLPNIEQIIRIRGMVAWNRSEDMSTKKMPAGMGIQFIDLDPEKKKILRDYIDLFKSS